ncbi:MAG: hypothetical protein HON38_00230 [Halieaceae bacterium]|nr:hypothetical protein [Halieaceae bacterium]
MSMMTNKHVLAALLVAPILAVLAWYGTGLLSDDEELQAVPAQAGASYPLIERPGCRYPGGDCGLSNEDFKLAIALTPTGQLRMVSAVPLDYVLLGLKSADDQSPVKALPVSAEQDKWVHNFAVVPGTGDRLRLVAGVAGASWFGEVSLTFTQPSDQ